MKLKPAGPEAIKHKREIEQFCVFLHDLPDDPMIRHYERPAIAHNVAAFMAVLQHYSDRALPWSVSDWIEEYLGQIGDRPPFERRSNSASDRKFDPAEYGVASPGDLFVTKRTPDRDLWSARLGLIATTCRPAGGVGTGSGHRAGMVSVLPTDGSLRSEIEVLRAGMKVTGGECATDHLPWTWPATKQVTNPKATPLADVAIAADLASNSKHNMKTAVLGAQPDPSMPLTLQGQTLRPSQTSDKSPWRWQVVLGALADSVALSQAKVSRAAPILRNTDGMPALRISSLSTKQGGTSGYHEIILPLPMQAAKKLALAGHGGRDAPSELARALVAAVAAAEANFRGALFVAFGRPDRSSTAGKSVSAAAQRLQRAAGWEAVGQFTQLLAQDVMTIDLSHLVIKHFERAVLALTNPLDVARGRHRLMESMKMPIEKVPTPELAKRVHATLRQWRATLTPGERATLRSQAPCMARFRLLASLPRAEADNAPASAVWNAAILHIASTTGGSAHAGRALAKSEYPEPRLLSLLAARDAGGQAEQAISWLRSTETAADISTLVTFALADIVGDRAAREWAKQEIAFNYVRPNNRSDADHQENTTDA
ncbi:MAG: hypothetical protein ACE368_22560 [Paracoccaceae bacterium]